MLFWEIVPDSDKEALYTSVWPNELNISPDRWYYLGTYKDNGNTLFVDNATVRKDSPTAILWTKENTSSETEPWAKVLQIVRRKERPRPRETPYRVSYPARFSGRKTL